MSFFSRICLNVSHPQAAQALQEIDLASAYREHQWLWRFFSDNSKTKRDFVFRRMEPRGAHSHAVYYVVSQRPPISPRPAWDIQSREYAPQIRSGQHLSFELRANPVITRDGRRHDVVMNAKTIMARQAGCDNWGNLSTAQQATITEQGYAFVRQKIIDWLQGNSSKAGFATRHGFALPEAREMASALQVDAYQRHRLPAKDHNGKPAWFSSVDLAGELVVTDETRFCSTLHHGVGHAKAFGCGLLLVRPM